MHSSYDEIARIKRCADKISSSRDNGMMEWHEDLRWNDVALPLQRVYIKLTLHVHYMRNLTHVCMVLALHMYIHQHNLFDPNIH